MTDRFVAIAGLIGAGKTTLAKNLASEYEAIHFKEPQIENKTGLELLGKFYGDKKKYGFLFQIYLLNQRYAQVSKMTWEDKMVISDRSIYEDKIFAKQLYKNGDMLELEYNTYKALLRTISQTMRHPDILLYLRVSPEVALERIRKRGRECESGITLEFLSDLYNYYEKGINKLSKKIPIKIIDYDDYESGDYMKVKKIVDEALDKRLFI